MINRCLGWAFGILALTIAFSFVEFRAPDFSDVSLFW